MRGKDALRARMKGLGFRMVSSRDWVSGVRHLLARDTGEFEPWTTFWNPGVRFGTPEAAFVWAEIEGWGRQVLESGEVVVLYGDGRQHRTGIHAQLFAGPNGPVEMPALPEGEVVGFWVGSDYHSLSPTRPIPEGTSLRISVTKALG